MQCLGKSKYIIFLILLSFQNLWNLINVLIFLNENIYLNVFYGFSKFDGLRKSRCDVCGGTTQGCFHPITLISHTPHVLEVFVMTITTFEKTHVELKFVIETSI
jgi:hypothetical protein